SVALSILSLLSFFPFCIVLQRLEPFAPERVEKRLQVGEPLRARAVEALRAVPALVHEPGLLEDAQMLRDRRPRHVELRGDLAGGALALPDELEDPAAPGLGDRSQRSFHCASVSTYLRKCQLTVELPRAKRPGLAPSAHSRRSEQLRQRRVRHDERRLA